MNTIERNGVGLRTVTKGEVYSRRCTNNDGHSSGVIATVAVTDGVCVTTPEGDEFFALFIVRKVVADGLGMDIVPRS